MSTAQQQHGGAAPDALLPGPAGDGGGAPANGDRDSVDDVIERLLSVRGECRNDEAFVFLWWCRLVSVAGVEPCL